MSEETAVSLEQDQSVEVAPQDDAPPATDPETPKSPKEEIYAKYDQARREEYGEEEPKTEPKTEPKAQNSAVEVVINGKKRQVDKNKVDKAGGIVQYQKVIAADEGLRELANERKRLKQEQEQLNMHRRQLQDMQARLQAAPPPQGVPQQRSKAGPSDDGQLLKQAETYRKNLYEGKDEEADSLFVEVIRNATATQAPQAPQIDPSAIENRVLQKISQRDYSRSLQSAQNTFAEEYSDITSDPKLFQMADMETLRVREEHPSWAPDQIIREAGSRIRGWMDERTSPTKSRSEALTSRKRSLSSVSAGSTRAKEAPAPRHMTKSEYVQTLRNSRNLD